MTETTAGYTAALYADVAAILAGGEAEAPRPTIGTRTDDHGLVYAAAVNVFYGPPESGKTLAASAIAADHLFLGDSVLVIDIDHNGAPATLARFRSYGISADVLADPTRFRYTAPEDPQQMIAVTAEARIWNPTLVILDSIGELLPLFNANSNDADEFTRVNTLVTAALARTGAAVIAIDHEAKSTTSSAMGASGTAAKKRAVDGVMLRFATADPFTPGFGGRTHLTISKDRHGGLRAASPIGEREPLAATFKLIQTGDAITWKFIAPTATHTPHDTANTDAETLATLTPAPTSVRDVMARMKWGRARSMAALKTHRERSSKRSSARPENTPPGTFLRNTHTPGTPPPQTP